MFGGMGGLGGFGSSSFGNGGGNQKFTFTTSSGGMPSGMGGMFNNFKSKKWVWY